MPIGTGLDGHRVPAPLSSALAGPGAGDVDLRLAALAEEFFVYKKPKKLSPLTLDAYEDDLMAITTELARLAGVSDDQVSLNHVGARQLRHAFAAFSDSRAPASVSRCWSTWNQFFDFLVADGIVVGNPMAAVSRPKQKARKPKALQGEDTPEQLLEAISHGARRARYPWPERDLAFVATALLAGLRLSELLSLNLGSLDGRSGERRIRVRGKGDVERVVPIEASLEAVIGQYLATRKERFPATEVTSTSPLFVDRHGQRLKRGGAQYLVEQSYKWAGVGARVPKGALVHALRHTLATRLAEDGASASEIQHILGHANLNTSQGYIDATANEQRAAVRANRTYRALERLADRDEDRTSRPAS